MRTPIAIQIQPFDIEEVQPQIDKAREAFVRYLADVRRKSTGSKHGLMGPVGKILREVKSGRSDPPSLKGYAVRVHEATGSRPSPAGVEGLESAIDCLTKLLAGAPVTAHDRILDRLDYGLYFDLRKTAIESKEARRQEWIQFLRKQYGDPGALSAAWAETVSTFEDLYLPKKAEGSRKKKATAKQQDVAAFWEAQGTAPIIEEEEE